MLTFRHWPGPLLVLVLLLVTLDTPAALEYVGRVSGGGLQHLACIPAHSAQQTNLTVSHTEFNAPMHLEHIHCFGGEPNGVVPVCAPQQPSCANARACFHAGTGLPHHL